MEFECQLARLLIGHTALDVGNAADVERAFREQHPRLPLRILARKIPRTEKPGGLQSMASQRVGHA